MNQKLFKLLILCLSMFTLVSCGGSGTVSATLSTSCIHDASVRMDGTVEFEDYKQYKKDKNHDAKDGYEWRVLSATVSFDDPEVLDYMPMPEFCLYDTADEELYASTLVRTGESMDLFDGQAVYSYTFTVKMNGTDYTECKVFCHSDVKSEDIDKDGSSELIYMLGWDVLAPEGYENLCAVVYPHQTNWPDGALLSEVKTDDFIIYNLTK